MKKPSPAKVLDMYDYEKLIPFINDPEYCGRMTAPDAASRLKGPCGDEMEFYLVIEDEILKEVKYYSEGCEFTRACAAMTARAALRRPLDSGRTVLAPRKGVYKWSHTGVKNYPPGRSTASLG